MGKNVGFIGSVRGKVGNIVFSKGPNGSTYSRAYQPQVANPKTIGQVDQRTKMNLVGRMSQVTPAEVLIGFAGTKRDRRSRFNRILLDAAIIDRSVGAPVIAKIAPEDIVFSEGGQALAAQVSTPAAVTAFAATIGLTLSDATLATKYGERIIVAAIDPSDKGGYSSVQYRDVMFDDTAAKSVNIPFANGIVDETMVCIYRVPFILNDEGAAFRTETLANDGTDIIAKVLTSNQYVRDFGRSALAATQVFTQA